MTCSPLMSYAVISVRLEGIDEGLDSSGGVGGSRLDRYTILCQRLVC